VSHRSFACQLSSESGLQFAARCRRFLSCWFFGDFELIAREHQKLLGVSILVISLVLVDFAFSKKPVGFLSKPDVFSRIFCDSFSPLAHFPSFHVLLKMVRSLATYAAAAKRGQIAWQIRLARIPQLFLN